MPREVGAALSTALSDILLITDDLKNVTVIGDDVDSFNPEARTRAMVRPALRASSFLVPPSAGNAESLLAQGATASANAETFHIAILTRALRNDNELGCTASVVYAPFGGR